MTSWLLARKSLISIGSIFFCCAIPWALIGSTMQAWCSSEHLGVELIGILGLARLPYALRFLWAPLMDRYTANSIGSHFGRRTIWFISAQLGLALFVLILSFCEPAKNIYIVAAISCLIAFCGATQVTAADGIKIECFDKKDFPLIAAVGSVGFKMGYISAGAGALILADHLTWQQVYQIMGIILILSLPLSLWGIKENKTDHLAIKPLESILTPFKEFLKQKNIASTLGFLFFYKLNILMAISLITTFFLSLNFTKTEVAGSKIGGYFFSLLGTIIGSIFLRRYSLYKCLAFFQIAEVFSGLLLWYLSLSGHNIILFMLAVFSEDLTSGMGNCGYEVFTMSLCSGSRHCSTHFALISSFMALRRSIVTLPAGYIINSFGWSNFFLICVTTAIPCLWLLFWNRFGDKQPEAA